MIKTMLFSTLFFSIPLFSSFQEVVDESGLKISTPSLKYRKERKLRLDNGLEVLLVSDPETSTSGAALAVKVGSWDDPAERAGMAHFVEHLLFLGTEKYPDEAEYTRYLDTYSGQRNAFTMSDRTVYMFSVTNDGFKGSLDRFGQFFIAPLFNPSGVDREMQAIEQEYCKNIPLDAWRGHYVKKGLANPKHPHSHFCMGNLESLKQISQDELKQWYAKHYSSDLMHLVVYSNLSLEEMESDVASIFSQVKKGSFYPEKPQHPIFDTNSKKNLLWIQPKQHIQKLEIAWEVPQKFGEDRLMHADSLISHVLGHEGENSLLSLLKQKGLADQIEAGAYRVGRDQMLFCLNVHLTNKGVKEYEKVIELCYQGISLLKQNALPRYLFDEVTVLNELKYTYQSKTETFDYVTDTACGLCDEPLESYPRLSLIPSQYAPESYQEFIASLNPQNGVHTLTSEEPPIEGLKTTQEKWLGATYALIPLSSYQLKQWESVEPNRSLALPGPNPYLPENVALVSEIRKKESFPEPTQIENSRKLSLYHAADTQFGVPKVAWNFRLKSPLLDPGDPRSQVLADLYCHCMDERLKKTTYPAALAGLHYSLENTSEGISLKIQGFHEKAPHLLASVTEQLHSFPLTQEEFKRYKSLAKRAYHNTANVSALKQGGEQLWKVLYTPYCNTCDKEKALNHIKYDDLTTFAAHLWDEVYIEGMLYGNMDQKQAQEVSQVLKKTFESSRSYPKKEHIKLEIAQLPEKDHPVYLQIDSKLPSNALILTMDVGAFDFKKRAAQEILSKGLEEPFFSELRTKQQTAYIVSNWAREIERELFNFFAIQSSTHEPRDLLSRFELFLESSLQNLQSDVIPEERFEMIRSASIKKLEDPAENLIKMGSLLAQFAFDYDADFKWLAKRIEGLKELTYEEFCSYANAFLGKENKRRFAVCVNGEIPENLCFEYHSVPSIEKLKQRITYKKRK
jgi:insulysin